MTFADAIAMSALGHSLRIHPASEPTFVRCWSNSRQILARSERPRCANNRLVRAGYNYVETRADSSHVDA